MKQFFRELQTFRGGDPNLRLIYFLIPVYNGFDITLRHIHTSGDT